MNNAGYLYKGGIFTEIIYDECEDGYMFDTGEYLYDISAENLDAVLEFMLGMGYKHIS